jgi:hypothetical protein
MVEKRAMKRIDSELVKQTEMEKQYWREVLKRVVAVITFLSERGLAFRGDTEEIGVPTNGNFLGCMELIAKFDPFLSDHMHRYGNPGTGNVSYLSSTTCDEFIEILASSVHSQILSEIKEAKYFGVSIDSTPDLGHTDQLTFIIRYCLNDGTVVERFLGFISIEQHDGLYLFNALDSMLEENGIDIMNCRSQSYDNASNMSGIYSEVQARFRQKNSLALWVPCAAHSLNLVGSSAAECCISAVNFFGVLQSIYVFLSASPQRWAYLVANMKQKVYIVQSLSETRWSAQSDATRALAVNYSEIRQALLDIRDSQRQPVTAVREASSIVKKLDQLDTALMSVIWNDILQKINIVNKALQEPGIEICTVVKLYDSLISFFREIRGSFDDYEERAKRLVAEGSDYVEATSRKRARKVMADDGPAADAELSYREKFKTQTFYVILDKLVTEMDHRRAAYTSVNELFGFLTDRSLPQEEIKAKASRLVEAYTSDLQPDFVDEFIVFYPMCDSDSEMSVSKMLQFQIKRKLVNTFPNVNIALRMYLAILGSSCEGERTFSVLKRVKNYLRSTIGQRKLSSLCLLSIESELLNKLNVSELIDAFAAKKCRKVAL